MEDLLELTLEQKKAFKTLKKAYRDCKRLEIGFYNTYGTLGAYDRNKISHYDDIEDERAILHQDNNSANEFRIANEWADDQHYFHPREKPDFLPFET